MGATASRENKMLNREFSERMAAQQSSAYGSWPAVAMHNSRADQYAYKADQTHARRFNRGKTPLPYAQHAGGAPYGAPLLGAAPTVLPPLVGQTTIIEQITPLPITEMYMPPPVTEFIGGYSAVETMGPVMTRPLGQPVVTSLYEECDYEYANPGFQQGFSQGFNQGYGQGFEQGYAEEQSQGFGTNCGYDNTAYSGYSGYNGGYGQSDCYW